MEVSAKEKCPTTPLEQCSEMKLTKTTKLFSIESIIANTNKDTSSIRAESPVTQENYYCPQSASEYPLPPQPHPSTLLPPGSHYPNLYNHAWFGGLFNAHFANNLPEKDQLPFPNFAAFANANEPPRVPLMFNEPSVIGAYQRDKLAQYFMNSLRGGGGGAAPGDCDKLTELIFRTSGYSGMPLFDDHHQHSEQSRSPFQEGVAGQQRLGNGPSAVVLEELPDQRHLSSALIGCLPSLMSQQIQGGGREEIHQQPQQQETGSHGERFDKGMMMMDTVSNDSCSDDLSLTLSPGESGKHRGEWGNSSGGRTDGWVIDGRAGTCDV